MNRDKLKQLETFENEHVLRLEFVVDAHCLQRGLQIQIKLTGS
jgi:hypothetical protein